MDLTAVESSNVSAIGYLAAELVLLVRYLEGSLYAYPRISATAYGALMTAPSKGRWLHAHAGTRILITKGGDGERVAQSTAERSAFGTRSGPLNVLDAEAEKCCQQAFASANLSTAWSCPKCGQEFSMDLQINNLRYWRPRAHFAIVRR